MFKQEINDPQFLAVFFPRGFSLKGLLYYIEYKSFCLVVLIGSPHPLPRKRMCPLLKTEVGGETHSLAGEGVGGPNSEDCQKLWYSI